MNRRRSLFRMARALLPMPPAGLSGSRGPASPGRSVRSANSRPGRRGARSTIASDSRGLGYFVIRFSVPGQNDQRRIVYKPSKREAIGTLPQHAVVHSVRWRPRTPFDRQWILSQERIGFLRAFSAFIAIGGNSATRALKQTIDLTFGLQPAKRTQMQPALDVLDGGGDFVEAARHTGIFDAPILGLLQAGQQTKITEVVGALQDYLEMRRKMYGEALGMMTFVFFEFMAAVSTCLWLEADGFSMFVDLVANAQNASAQAKAEYLEAVEFCRLMNAAMLLLLASLSGLAAFLYFGLKSSGTALEAAAGRLLMAAPLLREVATDLGIAETFGIFGRLLSGGIPWQSALRVVQGSATVGPTAAYWEEVRKLTERTALSGAEILSRARGTLHPWESYVLLAVKGSTPQLGRELIRVAEDRKEAVRGSSRKLVRSLNAGMGAIIVASVMIVAYLGIVQGQLNMADMNGLMESGGLGGSGGATP